MPKDGNEKMPALEDWWRDLSEAEAHAAMLKAEEYGSVDLKIMGHAMLEMLGPVAEENGLDEAYGIEMAIAFYVLGKVSRLVSAFNDGRVPDEDSWHDLAVYARMAQRVRATGAWPGVSE